MPPHCDTLDGPVVKAARTAIEKDNINYLLPWVPEGAEQELIEAFEKTRLVRRQGPESMDLAERWLFETAVRLHREGENAPYNGLKPAGLDWGPVVPKAEKALRTGDPHEVFDLMTHTLKEELQSRFARAMVNRDYDINDVSAGREYVQAELRFVLFAHSLYVAITGKGEHISDGKKEHVH